MTGPLLDADEPPPVTVVNAAGPGDVVLLCDHASNRVPRRLGDLGLDGPALTAHIAWDPGAAAVARLLSALLDAPLVLCGYSRLVIDCNRPLTSPDSIAPTSDGVTIPGNQSLSPAERHLRQQALFRPYHAVVADLLDARAGRPTALLSIHSFTPVLAGQARPWVIGVSYRHDGGLGARLLAALAHTVPPGLAVGDNQPYPIEDVYDYSLPTHGEARGLPNCMIELRQDGLGDDAAADRWARRLARAWRLAADAA